MKSRMKWSLSTKIVIALCAFSAAILIPTQVHAQDEQPSLRRAPHCTNGTASGAYGYWMAGQLLGVGPFLVNGIFTHHPDGTMDGDVHLTLGAQQIPGEWSGGTFKTNDDCTGSGKFFVQALNLEVTYNFIATDGGDQIELLNTNTINFMGQYMRRTDAGTYKMESNCRGVGFYTDSLGNKVNYVITAVDGGDTLYFQGTDPGVAVSGVARRIK